jgi:hypothetical protein
MPFSTSKSRRSPLQRLSDQRRSLALAGLAAGAVLGGAIFRRRRRGVRDELLAPVPGVERPVEANVQSDFGPPAAVDVPAPASDPEVTEPLPDPVDTSHTSDAADADNDTEPAEDATETPINAATVPTEPAGAEAPLRSEPATGELNAEEASILSVLAQNGRADDDRTAIAVATSLERETTDVTTVLRKLGAEGVVSGDLYTAAGDKIWAVTERGVRRLGAQH